MVIESEEELRVALEGGGQLSFSKAKNRWLIYKSTPTGLKTIYVAKGLEALCEKIATAQTARRDEEAISKAIAARRVPDKPIEAERIARLKYAERVTTLLGRASQHIFFDTVKVEDEIWGLSDEEQASRIVKRFVEQMKDEHGHYVKYKKLIEGDRETWSEFRKAIDDLLNFTHQYHFFYMDRGALAKRFWWHGWQNACFFNLAVGRRLLERLGHDNEEGEAILREATEEIGKLYEENEEFKAIINDAAVEALRAVEKKEGLKILDDDDKIYVPTSKDVPPFEIKV